MAFDSEMNFDSVNEFFSIVFTTPRLIRLIQYLMLHGRDDEENIAPGGDNRKWQTRVTQLC